jgi:hypothetical protein
MDFLVDLDQGAIRQQHPYRDLQTLSGPVNDGDRTVSPFRPAEDLKCRTIKRMERIENLDLGAFRAQGIVGVDVITHICIVWSQEAVLRPMAPAGSIANPASSFTCACCRYCFAACFSSNSSPLLTPADYSSSALWKVSRIGAHFSVTLSP